MAEFPATRHSCVAAPHTPMPMLLSLASKNDTNVTRFTKSVLTHVTRFHRSCHVTSVVSPEDVSGLHPGPAPPGSAGDLPSVHARAGEGLHVGGAIVEVPNVRQLDVDTLRRKPEGHRNRAKGEGSNKKNVNREKQSPLRGHRGECDVPPEREITHLTARNAAIRLLAVVSE